jgi:preprotein translocase subunit SecA
VNTNDGRIRPYVEISSLPEPERQAYIPMMIPPTPTQQRRGRVGRNDPCPCGSGKKFKKCHWTGGK